MKCESSKDLEQLLAQASPRQRAHAFERARHLIDLFSFAECPPKDRWTVYVRELEEEIVWEQDEFYYWPRPSCTQLRYYDQLTDL